MKLLVFGSTGGIGRQVVEQALAAGHTVTAVARNPAALTINHERLEIVKGDVLDLASIRSTAGGHDAVVSAIGTNTLKATTLYSVGMANILKSMQAGSVRRITAISAGALDTGPGTPLWQTILIKLVLQRIFRQPYADTRRMEDEIEASRFDWTLIRAPRLTNGPHTGRYRIGINRHMSQSKLSRADVADYVVNHLDDTASYKARIELSY